VQKTLNEIKIDAQIEARKAQADRFIFKNKRTGEYGITDKPCLFGEWYHVYPDGEIIQRGV